MKNDYTTFSKLITGLFKNHDEAGKAYNSTLKLGYKKEEINVLMSEESRKDHHYHTKHPDPALTNEAIKGAGVGGALGVTTGAITGTLIALGTFLIISGFGVIISGPISVALAGASAGGIAGGLVGALINIGISDDHAQNCAEEIKNGGVLIALSPHSTKDSETLAKKWEEYGGIVFIS